MVKVNYPLYFVPVSVKAGTGLAAERHLLGQIGHPWLRVARGVERLLLVASAVALLVPEWHSNLIGASVGGAVLARQFGMLRLRRKVPASETGHH